MYNAEFFGTFDVTALILTAFTLFFFGLIIYLRREDRREGYPIESDETGRLEPAAGLLFAAQPKTFRQAFGQGDVSKPDGQRESVELKASRRSNVSGTPYHPVGDPMLSGVGPGAYAQRAKTPDLTDHGVPKIVPLRGAAGYFLDNRDPDPRGMTVLGVDGKAAGVVTDVWIDRGEFLVRYLEVELASVTPSAGLSVVGSQAPGRKVLLPMTMAVVRRSGVVKTDAILSTQFADVPGIEQADIITRDEEERVTAYYGAGYLYATPARMEPLL
ncbi:photosynthetic reaction center subunit H [soil metagenome]